MAYNEELEQDKREFIFFVLRRYIRFCDTIEKIIEESGELNDDDMEVLEPYYKIFYHRKKGTGS